ncbi:MAG TPA: hypothetical protein VJ777_19305 [Mycobacterium sp.]|nr:hypothetical protein [Mycobacterium sp.]
MSNMVRLTDITFPDHRQAETTAELAGLVVSGWLAADGHTGSSPNVDALVRALHRGDWVVVHKIADRLSLSVEALS